MSSRIPTRSTSSGTSTSTKELEIEEKLKASTRQCECLREIVTRRERDLEQLREYSAIEREAFEEQLRGLQKENAALTSGMKVDIGDEGAKQQRNNDVTGIVQLRLELEQFKNGYLSLITPADPSKRRAALEKATKSILITM